MTPADMLQAIDSIPEMIRTARKEAGLTQVEFAREIGVSQMLVSSLERGERSPSLATLTKVAKFMERKEIGKSQNLSENSC